MIFISHKKYIFMFFLKKNIHIFHITLNDTLFFLKKNLHTHVLLPVYETYFRFTIIDHSS
jgi:hypothetical protein